MNKTSLLLSAEGIILGAEYAANGTDFDKIVDDVCYLYEQNIISLNHTSSINKKRGKRISKSKHFAVIRIVLSCLYFEWSHSTHGNHKCVRYYRTNSKYKEQPFSFDILRPVIDWLNDNGYIECSTGYYYRNNKKGRMSRIRPEAKLSNRFRKIVRPTFKFDSNIDIINIRDTDKNNGIDTTSISEVVDSLFTHNSNVSNLDKQRRVNRVRLNHNYKVNNKIFVISPLYRVFNNSSFGEGGRFYGSEEQHTSKNIRKKLRINNQPTVERDFKNLHVKMLYDLVGIPLTLDAYTIPFQSGKYYDRTLMKTSVMMLINALTEEKARKAIQNELNNDIYDTSYKAKDIIRDIKSKHQSISKYFGSGKGLELQNIDSEIALEVMYHFAKNDIPCLCIHDSFIVAKQHQNELDEVMKAKYCEVMKFKQFRMLTIGKNVTMENLHWETYLKLPTNNAFSVGID